MNEQRLFFFSDEEETIRFEYSILFDILKPDNYSMGLFKNDITL